MLTNQVDEPLGDIDLVHREIIIIIKYSESESILEAD